MKISWRECTAAGTLLLIVGVVLLPALSRARESARRASCQNNLKQMGLVMKMYANEASGEYFPPLSSTRDNWMMDMSAVYPEYLTDLGLLICPSSPFDASRDFRLRSTQRHPEFQVGDYHPDCASGKYYTYTGFALTGDEPALALYTAYHIDPASVQRMENMTLPIPKWERGNWTPMSGGVPAMWDRIPVRPAHMPHLPQVINVLCMDGSVQAVKYSPLNHSENFPVTEMTAWTFGMDRPRLDADCY